MPSPSQIVNDFFDCATDAELDELLAEARRCTTPEDIEMWAGDDSDFFPLPEEG